MIPTEFGIQNVSTIYIPCLSDAYCLMELCKAAKA